MASGAEVKFDGALYASVLFPHTSTDETQYLKPDGTPLPQQEIADLNELPARRRRELVLDQSRLAVMTPIVADRSTSVQELLRLRHRP